MTLWFCLVTIDCIYLVTFLSDTFPLLVAIRAEEHPVGIEFLFKRRNPPIEWSSPTATSLARAVVTCPICNLGFQGHNYACLAMMVCPVSKDDKELGQFIGSVTDNEWTILREFQRYDVMEDDLIVYAIRCSDRISVTIIKSHFEVFLGDHWIDTRVLSLEESAKLIEVFTDKEWIRF